MGCFENEKKISHTDCSNVYTLDFSVRLNLSIEGPLHVAFYDCQFCVIHGALFLPPAVMT
jgi:hypothetical protein